MSRNRDCRRVRTRTSHEITVEEEGSNGIIAVEKVSTSTGSRVKVFFGIASLGGKKAVQDCLNLFGIYGPVHSIAFGFV